MPFWPVPDQVGCFIESHAVRAHGLSSTAHRTDVGLRHVFQFLSTQTINKPEKSPLRCLSVWFACVDYLHSKPKLVEKVTFSSTFEVWTLGDCALGASDANSHNTTEPTARTASPATASRACFITERLQFGCGPLLNGLRSACTQAMQLYLCILDGNLHHTYVENGEAINHLEFPFYECRKEKYIRGSRTTWSAHCVCVIAVFRSFESSTKRAFYTSDEQNFNLREHCQAV